VQQVADVQTWQFLPAFAVVQLLAQLVTTPDHKALSAQAPAYHAALSATLAGSAAAERPTMVSRLGPVSPGWDSRAGSWE